MRSASQYSQAPELLQAFAPEFREEHYHMHGRHIEDWESLKSIFLDEHHTVNVIGRKVLKGAFLGWTYGWIARNFFWRGPKSFELDRLWMLNKGSPRLTSLRGYTAFGAVMGAVWWAVKDYICVPHGEDTYGNNVKAYGLMGGILVATIVHPANFFYGVFAGILFAGAKINSESKSLPRGMEWKIKSTDEQRRRRLLRQDEEYELSKRNVLSLKSNLYPL